MAFGRKIPSPAGTAGSNPGRTTSYPQGQDSKAAVVGEKRTTSYRNSIHVDPRDYQTIN